MVTATMRRQIDAASRLPGFRTEADVVRYALERILPELLDGTPPPASDAQRYAGRTRLLVDTAQPREKRVGTPREPVRLRDDDKFAPLDTTDLEPHLEALDRHVSEMAEELHARATQPPQPGTPEIVQAFDAALEQLGITPRPPVTSAFDPLVSDERAAGA